MSPSVGHSLRECPATRGPSRPLCRPARFQRSRPALADPRRKAYTEQTVFSPTVPAYWAYNPAYAEVQNTHVWSAAWADIIRNSMTPEAAAAKAFTQIEAIFAKYPIAQS